MSRAAVRLFGGVVALCLAGFGAAPPAPVPVVTLPPLGKEAAGHQASGPLRTGVHRKLAEGITRKGKWRRLRDGSYVWLLGIRSAGARGVRVYFADFHAGKGRVLLYGRDASAAAVGPYEGDGPNGGGEFWSGTVFGPEVVLEYRPAGGRRGALPFRLTTLAHQLQ